MKRYLLPLTVIAGLAIAGPAPAKEVAKAKVCGASGCHETTNKDRLAGFEPGGSDTTPPKSGGPFYTVTLTIRAEQARDQFTVAYLPGQKLIRSKAPDGSQSWIAADPRTAARFDRLIGDLKPFPTSRLGRISPPSVARVQSVVYPPAAPDDGGFPWLVVILAGAGAVGLAGVMAMRRRLRSRRGTSSAPAPTTAA